MYELFSLRINPGLQAPSLQRSIPSLLSVKCHIIDFHLFSQLGHSCINLMSTCAHAVLSAASAGEGSASSFSHSRKGPPGARV